MLLELNRIGVIIFCLFAISSHGQKLRVDRVNKEFSSYRKSDHFDCIHDNFDSTKLTWVADLTVTFDTINPGTIRDIFRTFKEKATKFGANGFKVNSSDIFTIYEEKHISISTFWLRMEDRDENLNLFKEPVVYLFGFLGYHLTIEGYELKVGEEEYILSELRYRVYPLKIGQTLYVQQGGNIRGDYRNIKYEKHEFPKYLFFNRVTGAIKNCWIDEYDLNFGEFLLRILVRDGR